MSIELFWDNGAYIKLPEADVNDFIGLWFRYGPPDKVVFSGEVEKT